jgi:hypothetical protein
MLTKATVVQIALAACTLSLLVSSPASAARVGGGGLRFKQTAAFRQPPASFHQPIVGMNKVGMKKIERRDGGATLADRLGRVPLRWLGPANPNTPSANSSGVTANLYVPPPLANGTAGASANQGSNLSTSLMYPPPTQSSAPTAKLYVPPLNGNSQNQSSGAAEYDQHIASAADRWGRE